MESEEPEIKSKQASKRDRNFKGNPPDGKLVNPTSVQSEDRKELRDERKTGQETSSAL